MTGDEVWRTACPECGAAVAYVEGPVGRLVYATDVVALPAGVRVWVVCGNAHRSEAFALTDGELLLGWVAGVSGDPWTAAYARALESELMRDATPWNRGDTLRITLPGIPARLYRVTDVARDGTLSLEPVDA